MNRRRFTVGGLIVLALVGLLIAFAARPVAQAQTDQTATFTVESSSYESHYPRGLTFTIQATSTGGDITRATLFYYLRTGLRNRANAKALPS